MPLYCTLEQGGLSLPLTPLSHGLLSWNVLFSSTKLILSGPCCSSQHPSSAWRVSPDTFPRSHAATAPACLQPCWPLWSPKSLTLGTFWSTHSPPQPSISLFTQSSAEMLPPRALPSPWLGPGPLQRPGSAPPPPDTAPSTQQAPCVGRGGACRCA